MNADYDGRSINPFAPPCDGETIRIGNEIWERHTDGTPWTIRLRKPGTREYHPGVNVSNVQDFIRVVRDLAVNAKTEDER